jgi:hypothetical protein
LILFIITQKASNITKDKITIKIHNLPHANKDKYANTYHTNIIHTSLNNHQGLNSMKENTKLAQAMIKDKFSIIINVLYSCSVTS